MCALLWLSPALAHQFAPSLLELEETGDTQVRVFWKQPLVKVAGSNLTPVLPGECTGKDAPDVRRDDTGMVATWRIDCPGGLSGKSIAVEGIAESRANVLLRIVMADGTSINQVLTPETAVFTITGRQPWTTIVSGYATIGGEHILGGFDHLLFVLGLTLLAPGIGSLLRTVTAFTVGHSVTLGLAVLGFVNLPPAPVEIAIAASILVLAVDLTRQPENRWLRANGWPLAAGFGLLHGLGFAGALSQVGLPQSDIPLALLAFNIGIEIGQIAFVVTVLLASVALVRLPRPVLARAHLLPAYVIGVPAAFWMIERGWGALGIGG
ncbi:HupE/UreJ family protein [Breoghania sp. L-A4]|nr:HupE/UreJ family protein [Breoghania sp. L-A4]